MRAAATASAARAAVLQVLVRSPRKACSGGHHAEPDPGREGNDEGERQHPGIDPRPLAIRGMLVAARADSASVHHQRQAARRAHRPRRPPGRSRPAAGGPARRCSPPAPRAPRSRAGAPWPVPAAGLRRCRRRSATPGARHRPATPAAAAPGRPPARSSGTRFTDQWVLKSGYWASSRRAIVAQLRLRPLEGDAGLEAGGRLEKPARRLAVVLRRIRAAAAPTGRAAARIPIVSVSARHHADHREWLARRA